MKVPFSTKLDRRTVQRLKKLSRKTNVPQARLVEDALGLLFKVRDGNSVDAGFRKLVEETIAEDLEALKILAK